MPRENKRREEKTDLNSIFHPAFMMPRECCDSAKAAAKQEKNLREGLAGNWIDFMICDSDRFQRLDLLRKRSFVTETLLFAEEVLVKPRFAATGRLPKKLKIINRYRYSEYDTLVLDNYRISGKK